MFTNFMKKALFSAELWIPTGVFFPSLEGLKSEKGRLLRSQKYQIMAEVHTTVFLSFSDDPLRQILLAICLCTALSRRSVPASFCHTD